MINNQISSRTSKINSLVNRSKTTLKSRQKHKFKLSLDACDILLEPRMVPAIITWDGGAGTMNWNDDANWDGDVTPTNIDDVIIPDLPGSQTIILNASSTILSINSAEGLTVSSGYTFAVSGGNNSEIQGLFTIVGSLNVSGSNANFRALNTANINSVTVRSQDGANVTLGALGKADNSSIYASGGGVLTFPNLTTSSSMYFGANWDGDSSQRPSRLNLPQLLNAGGYSSYRALDGGSIYTPKLNNLDNDTAWVRGANSTMNLSNVTTLTSSYINLENASAITGLAVTSMTGSDLYLQCSTISSLPLSVMQSSSIRSLYTSNVTLPNLTTASSSTFRADYGGTLNLPNLTTVSTGDFGANYYGDGSSRPSRLNLPQLQSAGGYSYYRALDGGTIHIPNLNNLENDNVYIRGANSTMNLSNVTTLTSSYLELENASAMTSLAVTNMTGSQLYLRFSTISSLPLSVMQGSTISSQFTSNVTLPNLTTASYSTFRADYGGTLNLPNLTSVSDGYFGVNYDGDGSLRPSRLNLPQLQSAGGYSYYRALDGGTIHIPNLNNLENDNVYIRGANSTMNLSNITTLNSSYLNLENASAITSLAVTNMTGSQLYLQCSTISSLPLSVMQSSTISSWYTSNLTLPNLTTASSSTFRADYGGTLNLPNLTSVSVGYFGANYDGDWSSRPSRLNLPQLQSADGASYYRALDGGTIDIPNLNNLVNDNVNIRGANSTMNLSNITTLNSSYLNLENASAITSLAVTNMTGSQLYLQCSTISSLPLSVMQSSTISSWYTSNLTLPNLTTASSSTFRADYGGTLNLPNLTSVSVGYFGANYDGDWSSRPSRLNVPLLRSADGASYYRALDGGSIHIPNLINLLNDNVYIRGANSTMNLSNVTTLNSSSITIENASAMTSLAVTKMTGSQLYLQCSTISSLPLSVMQGSTIYSWYTSNLTLPNLTTATGSTFRADYGGTLNLPNLTNVNGGNFGANYDGDWYLRSSRINLAKYSGNSGTTQFTARDTGVIIVSSPNFSLSGSSSSLWLNNYGTLYGNITLQDGASIFSSYGDGTFNGSITNESGIIRPNYEGSAGKLSITGNYTQLPNGKLFIDLNGTTPATSYDQVVVGGTAQLAGVLKVSAGFTPSIGNSFEVLKAASVVNDFQVKILPTLSSVQLVETTSANAVIINAIASTPLYVSDAFSEEGDTNYGYDMGFTIRGVAPTGGLTVNYTTTGGNPGVDYVAKSGSFNVAAGQYSQTIFVSIKGNQLLQAERLFQLQATASGVPAAVGTGLIYDDDAPSTLSFSSNISVTSPGSTFTPTPIISALNRYGNYVQGVTINLSVSSSISNATATFSNGSSSAAVTTNSTGRANLPLLTANANFGAYLLNASGLSLSGSVTAISNMTLVNAGNTGITWDGGAGTNNWDDELNWNEDRLPLSFDVVTIGDLPGNQTIFINSSPTVRSIQSAESIRLASSKSMLLTSGNSSITGSLTLDSVSSLSANGSASLIVTGGSAIVSACLTVTSGGKITINGNSTAISPIYSATGNGSLIQVTGLDTIQTDYYRNYRYTSFETESGGAILLPNLTNTLNISKGSLGSISIYGSQSLISLPKLTQLDGIETINVNEGGNISLPMVTTAKNLNLYATGTGSAINFPNLTSIYSNHSLGGNARPNIYIYSNATISLPVLNKIDRQDSSAYLGDIGIYYSGSRLVAPSLNNINAIRAIRAISDVTFVTSGNLTNSGNLTIESSGNLAVGNLHFFNTNVSLYNNPRLKGDIFLGTGSTLNGPGTIDGNLTVNTGVLKIVGDFPGIFTVNGNYSQSAGGSLEVRIGGSNTSTYNQLVVTGRANLSGNLTGGFTGVDIPVVGKTYEIIKAGSVLNDFTSLNFDQYGWVGLSKSTTSNAVILTTITSNSPPSAWTLNSPAGGPLPSGVTLVGGIVLDMIGINDVRVVSQLSANSLFQGYYNSGTPSSYNGNPGIIGIQTGITANAVNALGGGLKQVAVRLTLWDGDTGVGNFDYNQNTFFLNGVLMGNYSNVTTQETSTNGLIIYSNNTAGGFRDGILDTGFFYSNSTSFLSSFFSTLSTGNVTFTSYDTDPYDNYYDYTRGIAGGLINVGLDPNVSPSSILLSSNVIAENQPVGTLIGTLSAVDANAADTHTFTLVTGTGSEGNGSFTIIGNKLYSNAVFDFEVKNSYSIRVRTTDNGGLSYEQALTITVTNVNEAPANVTAGGPYLIYQGQPLSLNAFATDPDANATLSYFWDINNDGTFGDVTGRTPSLTWSQLNVLGISSTGLIPVKVRVSDSMGGITDSSAANLTINQTVLTPITANQSTTVSSNFSSPLKVSATDSNGNPLANVFISFNAPGSGASLTFNGGLLTATSGSDGIATSAQITANATPGTYQVTASVTGVSPSAVFTLTNVPNGPSAIQIVSGNAQSAVVNTQFGQTLKVRAVDSNGIGISGVTVTFAAPATGASGSFAGGILTAITDATGIATSALYTANTVAGSYNISATVAGLTPINFNLTNTPDVASSVAIFSGSGQSTIVDTAFSNPLKVLVRDSFGNSVPGVTVTFAAPATGASGSFAGGILTAITDASGIATSALYSANTVAGSYNISATVAGLTPINFNLTNTPDVPVASGLSIFAGSHQWTIVNTVFSDLLKVLVRDRFGNNIPGVTVTFAAPASGASGTFAGGVLTAITDATGIATSPVFTANTIAGGYNVTATVATLRPLNFFLLNQAPTIRSFTIQKGSVGRSFIRYVDIGFDTSSTLNNIVSSIGTASPRLRMKNTGLDGTQNINYNLAGKVAAIDAVIAMDFGAQGIGGDRNSAVGDGSYVIELDRDNDGSFETSLRFFRLLGDVNGDKEVNTLDSSIVAVNIGATGSNLPADINGDGVVNAADALLARRQRGRRITI